MKGKETNGMFDIDIPDIDLSGLVADIDLPVFDFEELDGFDLPDFTLELPDLDLPLPDFDIGDD